MVFNFKTFIEINTGDGYSPQWEEIPGDTYLSGAYAEFDGYFTDEFYVALASINDGYYSSIFKRSLPTNLSEQIKYKFLMLAHLGTLTVYYLTLKEINSFNWNAHVYASSVTRDTCYKDVGGDFLNYYVPVLTSLGSPENVRLFVVKIA